MEFTQEQFLWLGEHRANVYSQFGEDGILAAIFEKIGAENRFCCECGAADGVFFSNTRALIEADWRSLQIEADSRQFEKLVDLYSDYRSVGCYRERVDAKTNTLDKLLHEARAPIGLDLLVIDVDGQDYWLFNSLVKHSPRVVMVEYDPAAEKDFAPPQEGLGQAGLFAVIRLGIGKYYFPVAITSTNVIFVKQELCALLVREDAAAPLEAEPSRPLALVAVMSTPRLGFLAAMDCIYNGLQSLGAPLLRGEGAFWHQTLERGIEAALRMNPRYILTFDYDVVFNATQGQNEIARLVCLLEDNPEADVVVAAQMKREGGPLLAATDRETRLLDPLVPITQGHFGLTVFRASVFERLPKPWFRDHPNKDNTWNEDRVDADIHFWRQAMSAGLNVQMSLDVIVGHLEQVVTWPGLNLQPVYQPVNDWRENGKPATAFNRAAVEAAVRANPALLYAPKFNMGE